MGITKEKLQELVSKVNENKPQESEELEKFHRSLIKKGLRLYYNWKRGEAFDYFIALNSFFVNYASLIATAKEIEFFEQLERGQMSSSLLDSKIHECYERLAVHQDNIKLLESELGIQ